MTLTINKKKINIKIKHQKTILQKAKGLMFKKKLKNEALIFHFKKPIKQHITMLFVFYPIDIIFLNQQTITEIKENLKPFTNYKTKNKANKFIELPKGFIKKHKIRTGTKITIQE